MKKVLVSLSFALGALAALPAQAQMTPEQLAGTWECFGPGQTHPKKPPIMHFGEVTRGEKGVAAVDVDGFDRTVSGPAQVTSDADGWMRVTPTSGSAVLVRGPAARGTKVSMQLRRDGVGDYRCVRLPKFDTPMVPFDRVIEEKVSTQ